MGKKSLRFFIVALVLLLSAITTEYAQGNTSIKKDESLRRGEIRATLNPGLFMDARVKSAYQLAKDIPSILDSIYCYCFCEGSFKHKSLLSCYVDNHAAM